MAQKQREQAEGAIKRANNKVRLAEMELSPTQTIEHRTDFSLLSLLQSKQEPVKIFFTLAEKEDYEQKLEVGG